MLGCTVMIGWLLNVGLYCVASTALRVDWSHHTVHGHCCNLPYFSTVVPLHFLTLIQVFIQ